MKMTDVIRVPSRGSSIPGPAADDETRADLMAEVQEVAARWHRRQRETMEGLAALQHALMLSRDPVRTAEVWMDWQASALRRLVEDARDQRDISLALARCCGDGRLLEPRDPGAEAVREDSETAARETMGRHQARGNDGIRSRPGPE